MISCQPTSPDLTACPDCDLLIHIESNDKAYTLYCPRCSCLLKKKTKNSIKKTLALSITGILLFLPVLLLPLLEFDAFGFSDSGSLLESILHLFTVKYYFMAVMVALSATIFPLITFFLTFITSLQLLRKQYSAKTALFFRAYLHLNEWAMLEVYLLGILVAIIKMLPIAEIRYLPGFFCFIAMALLAVCISTIIDKAFFWQKIEELLPQKNEIIIPPKISIREERSAKKEGLLLCHSCRKLVDKKYEGKRCPRCQATIHVRKPKSRERTWALLFTAAILLFPANLLPIMNVDFLGTATPSTIFDGIIYFFKDGAYFVGIVILVASVLVPFFKVIGLILLLCERGTSPASLRGKTKIYRFITLIGRWSMLDIFVIALLAATVDFGVVSSTWAAPGARWFCTVVTVTMFAAINFDPRIMWDKLQTNT